MTLFHWSRCLVLTGFCGCAAIAAESTNLPKSVDLRPEFERYGLEVRRQGARPTCSVFTVAGALEFAMAKQQGACRRLSIEYLNWAGNQGAVTAQDGGFFSDLWRGYARFGICTESAWPYQNKFADTLQPADVALTDAKSRLALGLQFNWIKEWDVNTGLTAQHLAAIKRTLHQGWPVCGGFRWPKQQIWVNNVLQVPPPEGVYDGHSVLLVGYRDDANQLGGGVFIFRNTAGGRDNMMPYAYALAYMNDAAWVAGKDSNQ